MDHHELHGVYVADDAFHEDQAGQSRTHALGAFPVCGSDTGHVGSVQNGTLQADHAGSHRRTDGLLRMVVP